MRAGVPYEDDGFEHSDESFEDELFKKVPVSGFVSAYISDQLLFRLFEEIFEISS